MTNQKKELDMCHGPLAGKILIYTVPLILTGILQLLFNAADTIVVGKFAGGDALAAVGSNGALINLIVNLFMGLSVGASVSESHAGGAKNASAVHRIVHTAMLTALIGGVAVMLVGFFGCRLFLTWMGTPLNVIDLSTVYMRIYFLGMPACMVYNFGASILRSIGDTKRPMYFLVIAGIVNVVLNLILVIVFHLSVAGVAIATAVSQVVSAVLVVRCLMKQTNACRFSIREMRIYPDHLRTIMRIGLPAGLQSSLFNLSNVFIQSSINSFGSIAMEGNTAASNLEGFIYISMNAFYHAALTFVGQNIGARQYHRIRRIVFSCIGLVCAVGMAMGFLIYSLREPLLMIYTKDSLDMIPYGVERMQCIATTYFLCGIMEVLVGAVRGMGASFVPMINSLIGACAFRVVWICTVFAAYRNLQVLYLSWPASWILTILLQGVAFAVIYHRFMKRHGTALAE